MTSSHASRLGALGRGVLGMLAIAFALGTATAIADLAQARGVEGVALHWLRAIVCSVLAVALIVMLRRRVDRRSLAGLGFANASAGMRNFGLGLLVTFGAAAVMLGLGYALGWLRFGPVSWPGLLAFVAANAAIAFFYEALPEELALRGYAYRNLSAGLRRWFAALCTIPLFLAVPFIAGPIGTRVARLIGGPDLAVSPSSLAQDPVGYLILLTVFGITLVVARVTTGSLWACIAVHLGMLTVNRVAFFGDADRTGWSVQMVAPDALLLIPGYLLLAAAVFLMLPGFAGRRVGWRERDPEARGIP